MNENQLRTFVMIVDEGSFTRAENRLFLTKQAIRKQVAALEEEVGTELLVRNPRGIRMSETGQVFYEGAKALLEEMNALRAKCREIAAGQTLRISAPPYPQLILEIVLSRYALDWPDSQVHVSAAMDSDLPLRLENHEIDLAECPANLHEEEIRTGRLAFLPLVRIPYMCLMAYGHPLISRECLTVEDLRGYTVTVDRLARREELCSELSSHGGRLAEANLVTESQILETIRNICYSHGIYCIPAYFAIKMKNLKAVPLDFPPKEIGLLYLAHPSQAVERFLDCARKVRPLIREKMKS